MLTPSERPPTTLAVGAAQAKATPLISVVSSATDLFRNGSRCSAARSRRTCTCSSCSGDGKKVPQPDVQSSASFSFSAVNPCGIRSLESGRGAGIQVKFQGKEKMRASLIFNRPVLAIHPSIGDLIVDSCSSLEKYSVYFVVVGEYDQRKNSRTSRDHHRRMQTAQLQRHGNIFFRKSDGWRNGCHTIIGAPGARAFVRPHKRKPCRLVITCTGG